MKPLACTWEPTHACDYRCPYCFFIPLWKTALEEAEARHDRCSPEQWLSFWTRLRAQRGEFAMSVAGGEPFRHPRAWSLLPAVSRLHRLEISTNLSWDPARAAAFDPARAAFCASFHPHFAEPGPFLEKVRRLKDAGFRCEVSIVAYPPLLERLPALEAAFRAGGVSPWRQPYQGTWEGRAYPASYGAEARALLLRGSPDEPTYAAQMRDLRPLGRACDAGRLYFRALPDGSVWRCAPHTELPLAPLGRIDDPSFTLSDAPAPCPAERCTCANEFVYLS